MTVGMQAACSSGSAATRYIADNREIPILVPNNNVRASLVSTSDTAHTLRPIAEQTEPPKRTSLLKKFIHFFQCKSPTTPHAFNFYGNTFYFDAGAIKRSLPGDELHTKASKKITKLDQNILVIRRHYGSSSAAPAKENKRTSVIRDLQRNLYHLKKAQAELERLKVAFGKDRTYDIGLCSLIDNCTSFRRELDTMIIAYCDKQRILSTEKIKQICSESILIIEKTEKLLKKPNNKFQNKAYNGNLKKALIENIHRSWMALEDANTTIRSNSPWYFRHELMEINNALTCIKEAARKLNFDDHEEKLAAVVSSKIPRAKLKNPNSPTQSNS